MTVLARTVPDAPRVRPLAMSGLSRTGMERANRIAAANGPVSTTFGALPLRATLLPPGSHVPSDWCVSFQFGGQFGGQPGGEILGFHCPHALLALLLRTQEPALVLDPPPSATLLALLADVLLQPSLPAWGRATGAPIRFIGLQAGRTVPDGAVKLEIKTAGEAWRGALSGGAVDRLLARWPAPPHALSQLPLPGRLWIGATELPASVVGELRPGDAVVIETPAGGGLMLTVAERWAASARRHNGTAVLTEALRPLRNTERENSMAASGPGSTPEDAGSLEAVPVRLSFDAGRLDIPLSEVRRLQAGSILPLGRGAAELVEISANGRRIGTGELVEVDGAVAVRIVRLFGLG